jgi:hypothetical protein
MRLMRFRLAIAALLLAGSAACIKEETTVTLYVDPTGTVTWSIFEKNVRSDEKTREDRQSEEQTFIIAARVHQHPAMTGLQRLGASNIKDVILQDKPPFSVMTEGNFRSLEEAGRRFLVNYGMTGTSVVSRDGEKWIWTLTLTEVPKDFPDQNTAEMTALLGDKLNVALREGEFIEADGFTINDDKRLAELTGELFEPRDHNDPPKILKLVWRAVP